MSHILWQNILDIKEYSHYTFQTSHQKKYFVKYQSCGHKNVVNFLFKETTKEKNVVKEGVKYEKIRQHTSTNDFISSNYDTNRMRYSTGVSKGI